MSFRPMTMPWDGDDEYAERKAPAPFGYLLALDLYGCNPRILNDVEAVYDFLDVLVERLGMTKQSPPFVFRSPPQFADKAGLSGWVPLIESGIQIHTLIPRRFVSIDVYCCRRFDVDDVLAVAENVFSPLAHEVHELIRGTNYRLE